MKTTRPANIFIRIKRMFNKTPKVTLADDFDLIDDPNGRGNSIGRGAFGEYYTISGIGCKILYSTDGSTAKGEYDNLSKAYNRFPHLFPKPYALVKYVDKFHRVKYDYTMEHIDMKMVAHSNFGKCENVSQYDFIVLVRNALYELGIYHNDLHKENVMYCEKTGNFKIIDADPSFLTIEDEEVAI